MEDKNVNNTDTDKKGFTGFAIKRIALGVLLTFAGLWIFVTVIGLFEPSGPVPVTRTHDRNVTETGHKTEAGTQDVAGHTPDKTHTEPTAAHGESPDTHAAVAKSDASHASTAAERETESVQTDKPGTAHGETTAHDTSTSLDTGHGTETPHDTEQAAAAGHTDTRETAEIHSTNSQVGHGSDPAPGTVHVAAVGQTEPQGTSSGHATGDVTTAGHTAPQTPSHGQTGDHAPAPEHASGAPAEHAAPETHAPGDGDTHGAEPGDNGDAHGEGGHEVPVFTLNMPSGVAFIESAIYPLNHELRERGWGWRPNDIVNVTDNVNNFQLGVLEVTRRTAVALAERISRTGSAAAFDRNLENAMNWFMITADRYWFPSPESKYEAGLDEWRKYRERLVKGEAQFHTRTDNLIPLLMDFRDLLGSCDENLVKKQEDDDSHVSHFKADDYFYYAQGVASAMHTILLAVQHDFAEIIESRRGTEVIHHAIESCHHAMEIDPLYITNASWSGILANHRANLAAPISHARFYIGVLIKTLST